MSDSHGKQDGGEFGDIDFNTIAIGQVFDLSKKEGSGRDIPPPPPVIEEINDDADGAIEQNTTPNIGNDAMHEFDYTKTKTEEILKIIEHEFNLRHNLPLKDMEVTLNDILQGQDSVVDAGAMKSESVKYYSSKVGGAVGGAKVEVEQDLFEYKMNHRHRGCFIIFNHMIFDEHLNMSSRKGTHVDARNLEETARHLGFEFVRTFNDLTAKEIKKWIKAISSSDHSDYDCFVCCVLTHGDENNIVYARDDTLSFDEFTTPFRGDKCISLSGKPKLFFIQACRGTNLDDGLDYVDAGLTPVTNKIEQPIRIPVEADFMFAFSTAPGYYAWRNQTAGSWFVQAVCNCLQTYGHFTEIMKVMTRVNRMVAYEFESSCKSLKNMHRKKQIPHIVTRLTAEVYFREKKDKHTDQPEQDSGGSNNKRPNSMYETSL